MNPHTYRERRKPIAHDSDNPIERVKTAYDLQAVAESFGFKFKVRGKLRTARCLLPSHEDTNPSFAIYPDHRFHCFGCNMHGDVLDLVALMTNKTLSEALADFRRAVDGGRRPELVRPQLSRLSVPTLMRSPEPCAYFEGASPRARPRTSRRTWIESDIPRLWWDPPGKINVAPCRAIGCMSTTPEEPPPTVKSAD